PPAPRRSRHRGAGHFVRLLHPRVVHAERVRRPAAAGRAHHVGGRLMSELSTVAPAFVEMAHQIVWASAATVDGRGRPRTRILHPYWLWDGSALVGWIATGPTPVKRAHLDRSPHLSVNYWAPTHDTCTAECETTWAFDDETRDRVWQMFKD